MAISSALHLLFLVFSLGIISTSAFVFTLENRCSFTIWPGSLSGNMAPVGGGGFQLAAGASAQFPATPGWSGRFWGRTGCNFDAAGKGKCLTGDCNGVLKCAGGGTPPVSLVEFTMASGGADLDFYDVSLVDGYNVGISVKPMGGSGQCQHAGCVRDLNQICPAELQIKNSGTVVACKSACLAFNTPEYCCTGAHATPATCPPTRYSKIFKSACPTAYSYAYDDASSTCTCKGTDYLITFCPSA